MPVIPAPFAGPFSMGQEVTSQFNGIGPRFGINANYVTDCGFGFMGEGTISALIGNIHSVTDFTGSGAELSALFGQGINHQNITDENVYQVVPGIDTKLAFNYKRVINKDSVVTLTAGWQAAVYVNAISQYIPQSLVLGQALTSGGIFVATMNHTLSNYSVQGRFVELSWQA